MTNEKLSQAVELSIRVMHGTATDGDKRSLQIFLLCLSKREEKTYQNALNVACRELPKALRQGA